MLGSWGFRPLDLYVDRRVLIPRPETEIVVEVALAALRALRVDGDAPLVVDLGTGSGAIALVDRQRSSRRPRVGHRRVRRRARSGAPQPDRARSGSGRTRRPQAGRLVRRAARRAHGHDHARRQQPAVRARHRRAVAGRGRGVGAGGGAAQWRARPRRRSSASWPKRRAGWLGPARSSSSTRPIRAKQSRCWRKPREPKTYRPIPTWSADPGARWLGGNRRTRSNRASRHGRSGRDSDRHRLRRRGRAACSWRDRRAVRVEGTADRRGVARAHHRSRTTLQRYATFSPLATSWRSVTGPARSPSSVRARRRPPAGTSAATERPWACAAPTTTRSDASPRRSVRSSPTSANKHGEPPCTTAAQVTAALGAVPVLDGGVRSGQPSTVVDATGDALRIVRAGAITID